MGMPPSNPIAASRPDAFLNPIHAFHSQCPGKPRLYRVEPAITHEMDTHGLSIPYYKKTQPFA